MRRREFLAGMAAGPAMLAVARAAAADLPKVVVRKDPTCGCCTAWAGHLREAGFPVAVAEAPDMAAVKARLGVPAALASCHTAEVEGYVLEGHVPADAVLRLLSARPQAAGLAVPGMPVGSPGTEVPGAPADTYDVVLFGPRGEAVFARYEGGRRLS